MFTILPEPRSRIRGTAARAAFSTVRALRLNMKSQVSSDVSSTVSPMVKPPAMLARMSMSPICASASAVAAASVRSAITIGQGASAVTMSTPVTLAPAS